MYALREKVYRTLAKQGGVLGWWTAKAAPTPVWAAPESPLRGERSGFPEASRFLSLRYCVGDRLAAPS